MIGNHHWANWLRHLGDILGLAALAVGAEVIGMRLYRDNAPNWLLWTFTLALAYGHWEWRTRSPKDDEVAKTNQYRTYAFVMAIGRILLAPWLAWYGTGGWRFPGGLTIILVAGYTEWARRLYKAAQRDLILGD